MLPAKKVRWENQGGGRRSGGQAMRSRFVVCVLAYLLASGVPGVCARDKRVRTLDVSRLRTNETKGWDRKPERLDAVLGFRHDDGSRRPLQRIDRGVAEFRRVG